MSVGEEMYDFITGLFPICRSLTGNGVRQTLDEIRSHIPELKIHEVPSGTEAFDWTVPDEWNIRSGVLIGPDGKIIADFSWNNLHIVGYSEPVDLELSLEDLQPFLHSLPEMPNAIPYVTSYYKRTWGICLTHEVRQALKPGNYRVVIDSDLKSGFMTYGEVILPGKEQSEVFLSTYICHPSMANNELSGLAVTTWLVKWLKEKPRRYTYRIVFIPETIGSIVYLSRHLEEMKAAIIAGYIVNCVGDDRCYSFLPSRAENTLSDRVARNVLSQIDPDYISYSFLQRGSDERQYCAPGVDLPMSTVMRSKYGEYPEYHTSLDNLDLVSSKGLSGGYEALKMCLQAIEKNNIWKCTVLCEPQLGKRGLYPSLGKFVPSEEVMNRKHVLTYADGKHDLIDIAEKIGLDIISCAEIIDVLEEHGLVAL